MSDSSSYPKFNINIQDTKWMYVHYEEIINTNPYIDDSTVAKNSLMEAGIAKKIGRIPG